MKMCNWMRICHLVGIVEREVRYLRSKDIVSVKVLWKGSSGEETTWEPEKKMRAKYPYLFKHQSW
jgi:hypothetical protein